MPILLLTLQLRGGTTSSPVVSTASYSFVAGDVGAFLFIKTGTNWTSGWYKIVGVSGGSATLNAAIGSVNLNPGNAFNTVSGCATVSSPSGGTWGIDYSQQSSPQVSYTDIVIDGTTNTKFTSSLNPVGKNLVGNTIAITSGTGFTVQTVQVVSTSGTVATCDKSLGTLSSTGGNGGLGGCLASLGQVTSLAVGSNKCWIKFATYLISTALDTGATWSSYWIEGYQVQRNDLGTKPILKSNAALATFMTARNNGQAVIRNLEFDGNAKQSTLGISFVNQTSNANVIFDRIKVHDFTTGLSTQSGIFGCVVTNSEVYNCVDGFFGGNPGPALFNCDAHDNTGNGFGSSTFVNYCRSYRNQFGFVFKTSGGGIWLNNIAYKNSNSGFAGLDFSNRLITLWNCISYGNGAFGYSEQQAAIPTYFSHCAAGSNTSGPVNANMRQFDAASPIITLTADPFVDGDNGNFALNNVAGGGALCRSVGIPGATPAGTSTGFLDLGAIQHQDSGGSNLTILSRIFGGF